jgi:hypothetical protein
MCYSEKEKDIIATATWKQRQYYPNKDRLLPTALGNILRAGEDITTDRYGLDAVVVWPRLYPLLPKELKSILNDLRNQLDFSIFVSFL